MNDETLNDIANDCLVFENSISVDNLKLILDKDLILKENHECIVKINLKPVKRLIDTLFMFEPKQCDIDPNLLLAKCFNKIENDKYRITISNLSNISQSFYTKTRILIELENTNDPECFTVKTKACENQIESNILSKQFPIPPEFLSKQYLHQANYWNKAIRE